MRFHVRHESLYRYDTPIALGSHVLRLTPRAANVVLDSHRLVIEPEPALRQQQIDAFGNEIIRVEFSGTTRKLRVDSEFELDTLPATPLEPLRDVLRRAPEVRHGSNAPPHPSVEQFAESLAVQVDREPVSFLDHLSRTLFAQFDRHIRPEGNARPAHETLALRSGACRDLTTLFLESCRSLGLAARFVSGYQALAQTPDGQRHLHAWAEVFLPGIGWRGWDATHGMRATDGHVALCAAPTQAATMPIEGSYSFEGSAVNCTLGCSVRITTSHGS